MYKRQVIIFLAGLRIWLLILSLGAFIASMPLIWFNLHDYQKQRILTHLDPSLDSLGAGYHINQSKIALGSGGVFGKILRFILTFLQFRQIKLSNSFLVGNLQLPSN